MLLRFFRKVWANLVAGALLVWTPIQLALDRAGTADFIITRINEPGWVGVVIGGLLRPPPWALLLATLSGVIVICWQLRRTRRRPAQPEPLPQQGDIQKRLRREPTFAAGNASASASPARVAPDAVAACGAPFTLRGTMRFDPTTHDGMVTVGSGKLRFTIQFYAQDSELIGASTKGTNLKRIVPLKNVKSGDKIVVDEHDKNSQDNAVGSQKQFVAENSAGYFMVVHIDGVDFEGRAGADEHEVRFTYHVDPSGEPVVTAI